MTTRESNKLLAEFLGYTQPHPDYPHTTYWYKKDEAPLTMLSFDTDWNWLVEVVEKIENYNDSATLFIIEDERCHVNTQNGFEIDSVGHTKIEAVYNACVEFVKWYNNQNK